MKALRFFPLAFISNVHGFVIFAPYLALALTVTHLARRRGMPVAVPINSGLATAAS